MNTPKQLGQAAITASATTLYTVPSATVAILKSFDICNTTPNQILVCLYIVPSAGTAGTANAILCNHVIPVGETFGWEGEQVMATGVTIQMSANITGSTITASGIEIT